MAKHGAMSMKVKTFAGKVPEFVKECVKVCWMMVIQEPPLVFAPDIPGDKFDRTLYFTYQTTGTDIRFVVWPAILLETGGRVLVKGVAECCRVRTKIKVNQSKV